MKTTYDKDLQNRDRTFADRRAFVLSETAAETTQRLLAERAAAATPVAPVPTLPPDPNTARRLERSLLREALATRRRTAFLQVLGELTYRVIPLDEHEKAPHRDTILSQAAEFAASTTGWSLSEAGIELAETTDELVEAMTDADEAAVIAAVTESVQSGTLHTLIETVGAELENRVVAAAATARARAVRLEETLTALDENASDDAELEALRARRLLRSETPTLLESLFVANRRVLFEGAGQEVASDAILAESICQYSMLEAFSAVGVLALSAIEVDTIARRLIDRKRD